MVINRACTGHGKPVKSWNFIISFSRPGKSWNWSMGHGKSRINNILAKKSKLNRQLRKLVLIPVKMNTWFCIWCVIMWENTCSLNNTEWQRANARNVSFILITVANLHFQLSWYNQITLLPPPTQHHSFFRNFHPLSLKNSQIGLTILWEQLT